MCASAYAAAGIANANPFRTGISAFTLGIAKLLVPMVFVYSPAMLIVIDTHFTWAAFMSTTVSCAIGVFMLSTSVAAFFLAPMPNVARAAIALAGVLLVAPGTTSDIYAAILAAPVLVQQIFAARREKAVKAEKVEA